MEQGNQPTDGGDHTLIRQQHHAVFHFPVRDLFGQTAFQIQNHGNYLIEREFNGERKEITPFGKRLYMAGGRGVDLGNGILSRHVVQDAGGCEQAQRPVSYRINMKIFRLRYFDFSRGKAVKGQKGKGGGRFPLRKPQSPHAVAQGLNAFFLHGLYVPFPGWSEIAPKSFLSFQV